jgi:hypothetical protein
VLDDSCVVSEEGVNNLVLYLTYDAYFEGLLHLLHQFEQKSAEVNL